MNKHYLVDLARIFTSIDTHILIKKPDLQKTPAEMGLVKTMLGTIYGNVTPQTMLKARLSDLLSYSGPDKGTDWRALLRFSLSG